MSEANDVDLLVRQYQQLFWLAARDIVFFSTYNEEIEDWDNGFHAAVNCNDTFYYACADAEGLAPGEAYKVRDFYERYGWAGVVAWAAKKRGAEPLKELQDDKYSEAMAELSSA